MEGTIIRLRIQKWRSQTLGKKIIRKLEKKV